MSKPTLEQRVAALEAATRPQALANTLAQHIDTSAGPDACWPWTRALTDRGYGRLRVGATHKRVHRLVEEAVRGPLAAGELVLHSCDNPPCCNPAHLRRGSAHDNMRDMVRRGRHKAPTIPLAVCEAMRSARTERGLSWRELAREFGVSKSHARRIVLRESRDGR